MFVKSYLKENHKVIEATIQETQLLLKVCFLYVLKSVLSALRAIANRASLQVYFGTSLGPSSYIVSS